MDAGTSSADLYGWFDTLTAEENRRRLAMRAVLERDIEPVADAYWDRGEFYHDALSGAATRADGSPLRSSLRHGSFYSPAGPIPCAT